MASYVVPQVEIHQLFSEIPASLTQNQVPFIFGPNYLLHRYEDINEKAGTYVGEYNMPLDAASSDPTPHYSYPGVLDPTSVDQSYTKLYADNAMVLLYGLGSEFSGEFESWRGSWTFPAAEGASGNKIKITVPESIAAEVTVGRKLRIYQASTRSSRRDSESAVVVSTPPYIDVTILKVANKGVVDEEVPPAAESSLAGSDSPDAKSRIRDIYDNIASEDLIALEVTIDESIDATTTSVTSIALCEIQNGIEIPKKDVTDPQKTAYFWNDVELTDEIDTDDLGIDIITLLKAPINDTDFIADPGEFYNQGYILSADLYVSYRELITSASDTIHSLRNVSEVVDALGAVSPDNPLAQAVYNAALNAGGQVIRYMAIPTDDDYGYDKVLNAATLTKEVYFLVPVTRKQSILDKVQSHVNSMSAPTTKRWRIAFVSAEVPNTDPIYNADATTDGHNFMAIVTAVNTTKKTADVTFVVRAGDDYDPDPDTRFKRDLKVGDIFVTKFNHQEWGELVPQEYKITEILSNSKIRVSDPNGELRVFGGGNETPEKAEIFHSLTNAEKAEMIRNISSNFRDRRIYNIFPSEFRGSGVLQSGEFAAAAVAGLVSACLPQQPVTNLELVGIDDVPLVYQTFSYDELNTMASGGTFIVMQDLPGDQVYIRHQISTDYEANNLNTAELSITKNLDSISYYFDSLCSPYIGKYNITPDLLAVLRNVITSGLTSLENTAWGLYGPQIIAEGTEILLLEQDEVLKDHVNCNLKLNLPYPFNHLVLKLFV